MMKCCFRVVMTATGMARIFALAVVCLSLVMAAGATPPFTESGGVIVFEAEDFSTNLTHGSDHFWALSNSVAGFSGAGYMEATPNSGLNNGGTTWVSTQPELQYAVIFSTNLTHYVWVRAYASNGNDDSVHAGIDGTTNTAAAITLVASQYNAWSWTTNRTGFTAPPTVTPTTNGLHTFSLWMREDGMRVDRVLLTTNASFQPVVGNAWHIPINPEADLVSAGIPAMRNPLSAIFSNTAVQIFTGNQFQGAGNPGNQLGSGTTLFYKNATNTAWSSLPMFFFKQGVVNANNKYYSNSIPANVFNPGDTVQYYIKIAYSDHLPTCLYGNDAQSLSTEVESVAQASPFSYMVKAPVPATVASPGDWRDQSIYQVVTDRFFDGDPSNNTNNPEGTYDPTQSGTIHGGDFKGLQDKLDYIKALGATAIWISPIVWNGFGEYHGYAGWNFYQIDPHWGTYTDLTNMVAAAHARGLYVVLDMVCNHGDDLISSPNTNYPNFEYPPNGYNLQFDNPAKQYPPPFDTNSLNPMISSLFHTNGYIVNFSDQTQVELGELRGLDDFRTETTYIRTNMMNIYQYWVGQAGFDGFRIDTVKHIDQGFWQFWCPQLHQFAAGIGKTNFFMFGEVEQDSDPYCGQYTGAKAGGNYELDSLVDYPLYFTINSVFANATGNTKQIEDHYDAIATNYDPNAWYRLVTFLDNHDHPRFLSAGNANNNTNNLAVALAFLYTARGIPCLYYGTEQAFNGGVAPDNREDMFAGQFEQGPSVGDNFNETHPLFQYVALLNNYRRLYPALRSGTHNNLWNNPSGPGLFAYSRVLSNEEIFVVFNTANSSQTLPARSTTYASGTVLVNLLNTNEAITVTATPNIPSITVPGMTAKIFIAQSLVQPLDPVVVSQSPAHAATNVLATAQIVLQFSKPMNTNAVQAAFVLQPPTAGAFSWSPLGNTMTFTAAGAGFPGQTTNVLHLAATAADAINGNTLIAPFDTYFVTAAATFTDALPPSVAITTPANGSTISGGIPLSGTASDNVAVAGVAFNVDGGDWVAAGGTTAWTFPLNTQNLLNGWHVISARATDTSGNVSPVASISVRIFNVPGSYSQRISAGDPGSATNCDSAMWGPDQAYGFNSFGYSGGEAGFVAAAISNVCAEAQPLYQYERTSPFSGSFVYLFDCPEGIYETTLLETETEMTGPNQRVFNVFIEGQQVLTNFDIFDTAGGQNIALTLVFTNAVTDSQLNIEFDSQVGQAKVAGVQVRKIADVDSDGDGIPDWWMLAYFNHPTGQDADNSMANEDADGDGMSNLQEFLSGTDPGNPNSSFRITQVVVAGNDLQVSWPTVLGKTYQLQRSVTVNLTDGWSNVGSQAAGTGSIFTQTDVGAGTNNPPLFYRVQLVQ